MICFIRLWYSEISQEKAIALRKKFDFKDSITKTAINYRAEYKGLTLMLYPSGRFEVSGSLHEYFNEGLHNYNDFSRLDLFDTVSCLCLELDISPDEFTIHGIEFGVNIHVDIPPKEILNRILSKGVFKILDITGGYKMEGSDFFLKIYDKTPISEKRYKVRVEVHVNRMRWLKSKMSLNTLSSLMKVETLDALGGILFKEFDQVIFWENFRQFDLTKTELKFLNNLPLRGQWENLKPHKRKRTIDPYNRLLKKYINEKSLSSVLGSKIKSKWYELLERPEVKKCNEFPGVQDSNKTKKCNDFNGVQKDVELVQSVMNLPLVLNPTIITVKRRINKGSTKKKCSFCRLELEGIDSYCNDRCRAKKRYNNKRHRIVRRVKKMATKQGSLFNENEGLRLSEKEREFLRETLEIAEKRFRLS